MNRALRTQGSVFALLAGWFVICLLCQSNPAMAEAHHSDFSEADHACTTVAEAVPRPPSTFNLVAESTRSIDQAYDLVLTASPSLDGMFGSVGLPFQRDTLSSLHHVKLYQLNRVYRL
jgi:hypothetical protein